MTELLQKAPLHAFRNLSRVSVLMKPQSLNETARPQSVAQGLRVEFLTELSQLAPLADRWEALNQSGSDHDAPVFQSFAWCHHVARVRLSKSPKQFRLLVATVWRGDDLVGVWPLSLQQTSSVWLARNLDDPFGQFAGVAFRDRQDIAPGVAAIIEALQGTADGMQIEAVIAGSGLHAALLQQNAKTISAQEAVIVDLRPHASFDAVMQTIGSQTRTTMRKRRAKLMRSHEVEQAYATTSDKLAPLMKHAFDGRVAWLKRNGRTSPAFRMEEFRRVIDELADAPGVELLGSSIKTGDRWIAVGWGFVYAGSYYDYMSAMDLEFAQFSPGRQILASLVEECFRRDIKVAELLAPVLDYKVEWSKKTKTVETMRLLFNTKSRLLIGGAAWAMSNARRASRMLPESLRKNLVARLNKN